MSSQLMKAGALALAYASVATAAKSYAIDENYEGNNFFNKFDFFSGLDPTRGYVQYQTAADAASTKFGSKLVETVNGQNYIGVDYTNTYDPFGAGRPSVRIETKKTYNHGLFLLDLAHMPSSTCGNWPAFWTYSDVNYPQQGEIDILENIHENTQTLNVLHTGPGFSVAGNQKGVQQSGIQTTYNCDDKATFSDYGAQFTGQGCAATNSDPNSYGSSLNAVGGGVYAMEWSSDVIRVWNFAKGKVPSDISSGKPDPSKWGLPSFTTAQGKGDIDAHFKDHKVVLDTTFCGNWAGQDFFWKQTSCYDPILYPTCSEYVGKNPSKYKDSYWLINSLKVYQLAEDPVTTSSSSTTSPTSSSTSSTASSSTTSSTSSSTTSVATSSSSGNFTIQTSTSSSSSSGSTISTATPTLTSTTSSSSTSGSTVSTADPSLTSTTSTSGSSSFSTYTSSSSRYYGNSSTTTFTSTLDPTTTGPSTLTSSTTGGSTDIPLTTSTVYTTSVSTVTKCPATVTNCPYGSVVTVTIPLYTTICPVSSTPTPTPIPTGGNGGGFTTSTVYTTSTGTVTKCPATVTNCPYGSVTTVTIPLYTTICPVSPPTSVPGGGKPPGTPSVSLPGGGKPPGTPSVSLPPPAIKTPTTSVVCNGPGCPPVTIIKTSTIVTTYVGPSTLKTPDVSTVVVFPTKPGNGTGVASPTVGIASTGGVKPSTTPGAPVPPIVTASGAQMLRVSGALVVGLMLAVLL